jgi:outer membrane protein OmpA-like peptidoglycan-associated protein
MKNFFTLSVILLIGCNGQDSNGTGMHENNKGMPSDSIIAGADRHTPKDTLSNYSVTEVFETITFDHNSTMITPVQAKKLEKLARICASDSISSLRVFGYTDTIGTEARNEKLSEKRAMAVYNSVYPKNKPLDAAYVTWLGESNEIYDLHLGNAHAQQNFTLCVQSIPYFLNIT